MQTRSNWSHEQSQDHTWSENVERIIIEIVKAQKMKDTTYSPIQGYSKLSSEEKIAFLEKNIPLTSHQVEILKSFQHPNSKTQSIFEGLSENVVSSYHLPFSLTPNFLINGRHYIVPMVTEESSVVAAAGFSAKFWAEKGGFSTQVKNEIKSGQIFFQCPQENYIKIKGAFNTIKEKLILAANHLSMQMKKRGGGILNIEIIDWTQKLENQYELKVQFNTADAMGANYINSCLEIMTHEFENIYSQFFGEDSLTINMSILSNFTPGCIVSCQLSCPMQELQAMSAGLSPLEFAKKFKRAIDIAKVDVNRAVTHNKGILNGIDAISIATGNDFRAIEANIHAYAAKEGQYQSLSECQIQEGIFTLSVTLPMAIGTVGGLTKNHPLVKTGLEILGNPNAKELMQIIAAVGLASHFSAIRALVTEGIQKGHMKLHLSNILLSLNASADEVTACEKQFANKVVSYSQIQEFLKSLKLQNAKI